MRSDQNSTYYLYQKTTKFPQFSSLEMEISCFFLSIVLAQLNPIIAHVLI
jgi:hypothetical protein